MAEIWGLAAAAIVGGGAAIYAGKKGAAATSGAARDATAENSRQFDTIRRDTASQRALGIGATGLLARLYGMPVYDQAAEDAKEPVHVGDADLPPGTTTVPLGNGRWNVFGPDGVNIGVTVRGGPSGRFVPNGATIAQPAAPASATGPATTGTPDMSAFFESPDFKFNQQQQEQALNRSLLAGKGGLGGSAIKEGLRLASGNASGEFGNFFNRLTTLAGIGSAATNTSATAGLTTASNNANIIQNAGNQRASIYGQTAAGVNNAVQGGLSNYMFSQYLKKN